MIILKIDMKILCNPSRSGLSKKYNLMIFIDYEIFLIYFSICFSAIVFILFDAILRLFKFSINSYNPCQTEIYAYYFMTVNVQTFRELSFETNK